MKNGVKDLRVYQQAYALAMDVFRMSKSFPVEEKYSLTDQIRRSSRSVCANLAEGYSKRIYPKHFVSKLSDSDAELSETLTWLDFAADCGYADATYCATLKDRYMEVGRMLGKMQADPKKFLPKNPSTARFTRHPN